MINRLAILLLTMALPHSRADFHTPSMPKGSPMWGADYSERRGKRVTATHNSRTVPHQGNC